MNYWIFCCPDVSKPIGGVKQLHRLAESISRSGRQCFLIQDSADFHPSWFTSSLNTISVKDWFALLAAGLPKSNNIVIFPETYILYSSKLTGGLPVVVFNQNGAYTFGVKPENIYDPSAIINRYQGPKVEHTLCVSHYDFEYLSYILGPRFTKVSRIINSIGTLPPFSLSSKKKAIAYMPRKNEAHSRCLISVAKNLSLFNDWEFVKISDMTHEEVIQTLLSCRVFFSFGHPEGFGLPVAEAMALGCIVIGYTGLGGNELFDIASKLSICSLCLMVIYLGLSTSFPKFLQCSAENESSFNANVYSIPR